MKISNWGNYPIIDANIEEFQAHQRAAEIISNHEKVIARGLGRCYGDSALSENIISTRRFCRFLAFDQDTGILTCESGVSLEEILDLFVPRGWFLPVTPGTKFVTVGGAIASDIHGKNHHVAGAFSNHVISMDVMLPDGTIRTCSKEENSDLFWATCGGMGLTGLILHATFRLVPIQTSFIRQETVKCENLDAIMDAFEQSKNWTYSVAWIDCLAKDSELGRSVLMRGEFAVPEELRSEKQKKQMLAVPKKFRKTVPFNFPNFVLNSMTVKTFNTLYYGKAPDGVKESIIDYDTFFYPLDSIHNWNRIYGKRGFTQYQFVLPLENSRTGLKEILHTISSSGQGSFLAVLKLFGKQNDLIAFPQEGYTLALDFPISTTVLALLDELDDMVLHYGGHLYLTKDVRMSEYMFKSSYKNSGKFMELKKQFDPQNKFQSLQSRRLGI
ncbi:MAG: FAD-binding oxidoreductase [bacterium]